jgi:hypothetical protein
MPNIFTFLGQKKHALSTHSPPSEGSGSLLFILISQNKIFDIFDTEA